MKRSLLPFLVVVALAGSSWAKKHDAPPPEIQDAEEEHSLFSTVDANADGVLDPAELATLDPRLALRLRDIFDANADGSIDSAEFQGGRPEEEQEHLEQEGIARLDLNGDGTIDAAELAVLEAGLRDHLLAAFDANGDAILDADEIAVARAVGDDDLPDLDTDDNGALDPGELDVLDPSIMEDMVGTFDLNDDGTITRAEVAKVAREQFKRFRKQKDFVLRKFDEDKDGRLDAGEKAAVQAAIKSRRPRIFARFDVNNDGRLDARERAAMKAVLRLKKPKTPTL